MWEEYKDLESMFHLGGGEPSDIPPSVSPAKTQYSAIRS